MADPTTTFSGRTASAPRWLDVRATGGRLVLGHTHDFAVHAGMPLPRTAMFKALAMLRQRPDLLAKLRREHQAARLLPGADHASDSALLDQIESGIRHGQLILLYVLDRPPRLLVDAATAAKSTPSRPLTGDAAIVAMSPRQRVGEAFSRSVNSKVLSAASAKFLRDLLQHGLIDLIAGYLIAVVVAAIAAPELDAVLLCYVLIEVGRSGYEGIKQLAAATADSSKARTQAEIDRAAQAYAQGIVNLGGMTFLAWLARRLPLPERPITPAGSAATGDAYVAPSLEAPAPKNILEPKLSKPEDMIVAGNGPPKITQLGGAYRDVKGLPGYEAHHVPANSISPLSTEEGPSLAMLTDDHRLTASWGNSREARAYRQAQAELIEQGDFQGAQQMDIVDIKSKFGNKYDEAIQQMQDYSRSKGH
jgi:hypothetical protein